MICIPSPAWQRVGKFRRTKRFTRFISGITQSGPIASRSLRKTSSIRIAAFSRQRSLRQLLTCFIRSRTRRHSTKARSTTSTKSVFAFSIIGRCRSHLPIQRLTFSLSLIITPGFPCPFPQSKSTVQFWNAAVAGPNRDRYVCNGPFTLEEWRLHDRVRVRKSATYWEAQTVRLNEIVFHTIDGNDIEERAFRSGQLHVTDSMPINRIDRYRREHPEFLRIDPYLGTYFYRVNVTRPPLNNRLVRRALAMAIDRRSIVDKVTHGAQLPASCFTPPNTAGYTCQSSIPYDVDLARKTLAQAGYPNGRGLPAIEILFNTSENHKLIAEAVQQMWR